MSEVGTYGLVDCPYNQWDPIAPADNALDAMGYGLGCVKTLNLVAGNKVGGYLNPGLIPTLMTNISVSLLSKFWNTRMDSGNYRWFVEVDSQFTYSALFSPDGDSSTLRRVGPFARPGGGTWARADFANIRFGIESYGDGTWDGEDSSGGEGRAGLLYMEITYDSTSGPVAEFIGAPREIFETSTVTFTDSSVNTPTSWLWSFGDTGTETSSAPTHVYTTQLTAPPNNKYTVILTATNSGGSDSETKTAYITVWKTSDAITADFVGTPVTGYIPLTVTFIDSSVGPPRTTWLWAFGDTTTATATTSNPSHIYSTVGTYTVSMTVSNTYVSDSEVKSSYITARSPAPSPDFVGSPLSGTRPLTVTFTSSELSGNEVVSYLWNFGDTKTSAQEDPVHIYQAVGTYTVTLTETNSYANVTYTISTSKTNYILVLPQTAVASFTIHNMFGYTPFEARFSDLSSGDITTWNWNFGETVTATSTEQNPIHVYRSAGTYTATLVVNSANTANSATATLSNITVTDAMSYGRFLDDLGRALLEPGELTPCEMFADFGGATNILDLIYDRVCRFQLETGALKKEATLNRLSGDIYTLPADLIELRRVEVEGQRVEPIDQRGMDLSNPAWEGTSGECTGYIQEPDTAGLRITLVPHQASSRTVKALYVFAPTRPTFYSPCEAATDVWEAFPLPYVFWWIIRYGVLADILKQEGDMYDPPRAMKCEEQWAFGIELAKALFNAREGG